MKIRSLRPFFIDGLNALFQESTNLMYPLSPNNISIREVSECFSVRLPSACLSLKHWQTLDSHMELVLIYRAQEIGLGTL